MLRKLLGYLVNWYPNTVFYSNEFLPELVFDPDSAKVHDTGGSTAALGTAIAASRLLKNKGDVFTTEFTGVTDKGADVGDFKITIERLN